MCHTANAASDVLHEQFGTEYMNNRNCLMWSNTNTKMLLMDVDFKLSGPYFLRRTLTRLSLFPNPDWRVVMTKYVCICTIDSWLLTYLASIGWTRHQEHMVLTVCSYVPYSKRHFRYSAWTIWGVATSREAAMDRALRSCNLALLDFFLRDFLKSLMNANNL